MNPLVEVFWRQGPLFDCLGLAGLGLVGMAATRLAAKHGSWGGSLMAIGAIAVLFARFYLIVAPEVMTRATAQWLGRPAMQIISVLPPVLLSLGLAGVVWGLWGHQNSQKPHSR